MSNREIAFRAWDIKKKIMLGCYELCFCQGGIQYNDGCTTNGWAHAEKGFEHIIKPTIELEQFTGLSDKNKKKIFEADILKTRYSNGLELIESVSFKDGKFMAEYEISDVGKVYAFIADGLMRVSFDKSVYMTECEVIGNIHEDPELLKLD